MIKLLIVDDSALMRKLLGKIFGAGADFELRFARNGAEALAEIARDKPDVVTLDIQMPDMDGLDCLDRIMIETPCPVVMVASLTPEGAEITFDALRRGAVDFVAKPSRAISLSIEAMGAQLLEKVRNAAAVKLRKSVRLRERVRHQIGVGRATPVISPAPKPRPTGTSDHGLVLVGASTGGPPALEALLEPLPANFPWPVLIAQHMPSGFTGPLARRLDRLCAVTVLEVAEPVLLIPGCVYIGRGDGDIIVARNFDGFLAMPAAPQPGYPWHPSVDRLVRSAMDEMAATQLVGVLMTGMGNDGAMAMAELRARGGKTIAESQESAVIWGMPGELVKAGGADFILPFNGISAQLQKLIT